MKIKRVALVVNMNGLDEITVVTDNQGQELVYRAEVNRGTAVEYATREFNEYEITVLDLKENQPRVKVINKGTS